MSGAEVTRNSQGKWLAWCEPCQDGYQGGKSTATKWADRHNARQHNEIEAIK